MLFACYLYVLKCGLGEYIPTEKCLNQTVEDFIHFSQRKLNDFHQYDSKDICQECISTLEES